MLKKIYQKVSDILWRRKIKKLQERYGFNDWHLISAVSKPYVKDIVNYIIQNSSSGGQLVECGCGLGDIIGNRKLKSYERVGVELSEAVYCAAKELHKDITFINGTFSDIKNYNIDFFIAVNFIHVISSEDMREIMKNLILKNHIRYIIVDEVTGNYPYTHNFEKIITAEFGCGKILGPYESDGGERYVKVFKKKDIKNS